MGDEPDDVEMGLVMPFVVCASKGGPYDDDSFVAGWRAGALDVMLGAGRNAGMPLPFSPPLPFPEGLVPQIDLMAMHHGLAVTFAPWEDDPCWVFAMFTAPDLARPRPDAP